MSRKRPADRRIVALFIDLENMCDSDMGWIVRCVRRHGKPAIARAYGNFKRYRVEGAAEALFLADVRLIHCPGWQNGSEAGKSCADETMMVDIQQTLAERPDIGRYVVCTGDAHFVPVVQRIGGCGREAIVIAPADGPSRMLERVAAKFLIAPPLNAEGALAGDSPSTTVEIKTSQEVPLAVSHNPPSGSNGSSRRRTQPNGPPPSVRPGARVT